MSNYWEQKFKGVVGLAIGYAATRLAINYLRCFDYSDKVVIVTGGSRGLGLVLARQLAAAGAKLAICARDQNELEIAQNELLEAGVPVLAQVCDVQNREQVIHFIENVRQDFGRIDVLINNAGVIQVGPDLPPGREPILKLVLDLFQRQPASFAEA